ncbi:MAG TPA: hypothetical protein VG097_04650 [Gemmata sp.]|jgi:hypothetical protein|nr:hypothetical protein [Gemmata sp.]
MRFLLSISFIFPFAFTLSAAEPPKIGLVTGKPGEPVGVEVTGLPKETIARLKNANLENKQWPGVFRVVVAGGKAEEVLARLPIAGTYTLTDSGIRFAPQFPLVPGREYRALLNPDYDPTTPSRASNRIETALTVPKPPPGPRVSITGIFPSGNRLPENTLRFYIHFSGEVARGNVYRHLKLIRDDGKEVKSPFLELDEELWSTDGKRLTILFHPGRVKRELVPREEEGPILEQGHSYTLTISEKWEDTEGRAIVTGFRKTFTAGPPENHAIDPNEWSLLAPRAGSDSPVIVKLPMPLDNALLGRMIWFEDQDGEKVLGTIAVGGGERVLTFSPKGPWKKGEYRMAVDTSLEDVCGNRVGEPFEVQVIEPNAPANEQKTFERTFKVR